MRALLMAGLAGLVGGPVPADDAESAWRHSQSLWVLTTSRGVPLDPGVRLEGFPLLVRLDAGNFDFTQARPDGADLRFTSVDGRPLAFQVEAWDAATRKATVWVRLPEIRGDAEQEIRLRWGHPTAASVSDGSAVFGESNGFAAVWHLGPGGQESVAGRAGPGPGGVVVPGRIGPAWRFAEGQAWAAGENLDGLPAGSGPSTTAAWIRPRRPNGTIVGWGNEQAQGKVVLQFRSPPHVEVDAYFSAANVRGPAGMRLGEWTHVAHTYESGRAGLYLDGLPAAGAEGRGAPLQVRRPARVWIGGWYGHDSFDGDLDEIRLSRVARPPEWIRLEYENQKPNQLLVGHGTPAGDRFGIAIPRLTLPEGSAAVVEGRAEGARKVSWVLVEEGRSTVLAVDRLTCRVEAGRFRGPRSARLELRAVHAHGVRTASLPVRFTEALADPDFVIEAPRAWDGRHPVQVVALLRNPRRAGAAGAAPLRTAWTLDGPGTRHQASGLELILAEALQGGGLRVTATLDNGGASVTRSARIEVAPPTSAPWVEREPAEEELPVDHQFYARGPDGMGTVFCTGRLASAPPDLQVFLRILSDDGHTREVVGTPDIRGRYRLSGRLPAGLVRHTLEFGTRGTTGERLVHRATNVVCGDAFLIQGQSNAVSTDWGPGEVDFHSPWIRTYGSPTGDDRARPA
ncbi:MAG: DUF2341 domain-containing protein, partial [Verrucomicrobiota bacterium]